MVLFGDVLKKLHRSVQVLGHRLALAEGLVSTVNQVLLSQLEQEVCAELDVEVQVVLVTLGVGDVQVQSLVKALDGQLLVVLVSP